jgi:hypothetical protein
VSALRTSCERLLQDRTTSRLHVKRTRNNLDSLGKAGEIRGSSSSTIKCSGACQRGTDRFPSDMIASRGPWPGPRTGARRGAASAAPSPNRIGQTSQILMESNFCV